MSYAFDEAGFNFKVFRGMSALDDEDLGAIRTITVESGAFLPSYCEIEFIENADKIGYSASALAPGTNYSVYGYAAGKITGSPLFYGQVRGAEVRVDPGMGARTVVHMYDKALDMLGATKTRGFKQSSYSDVVKKIAKEYGLAPLIGSAIARTNAKYDLVVQENETDWDFICRLARSVGYVVFVRHYQDLITKMDKHKLYFGPNVAASSGPGSSKRERGFEVGDNRIIALRALVSGAGFPSGAASAGWDTKSGQGAPGSASVGSKQTDNMKPKNSPSRYTGPGRGTRGALESVASTRAQSNELAKAQAKRMGAAAVDIELIVRAHPAVSVNTAILIDRAGPLEGKYAVTAVTHVIDAQQAGFTSTIYCTGLEDRTIAGIQGETAWRPKLAGVYPAVVSSIKDPQKKGRVQLTLPWLDATYVTGWAPLAQMGAGAGTGWQVLPAPKDEVLVAFQNGQLDSPFVIGGLHSSTKGKVSPDKLHKDGTPIQQVLTSKLGHQIIINDDAEKSGIVIQTKNGETCRIELSDKKGIVIVTKGDKKPIQVTTDSDVIVNTKKNAKISAQDVSVDAKGKVNVKGKGAVSVSGQSVTVDASGAAKLKGSSVTVEATGSLNLKASGQVNIKGSMVNIN